MATNDRMLNYKNRGKSDMEELRRKREIEGIQLRKQRRDEHVFKRRNINFEDLSEDPAVAHIQSIPEEYQDLVSLHEIVGSLLSKHPDEQLERTRVLRKILSKEPSPPIAEVIQAGAVPVFVEMLRNNDLPQLQFEAAWALTNIASGTRQQTAVVVEAQAVPIFISLLSSPLADLQEQAVWALGNISGDGPKFRDFVLDGGVITPLMRLCGIQDRPSMLRNVVWTISNLCRGKAPPPDFDKVKHFLPILAQMLFHTETEILADTCWALSYLADGPNNKIQAVIDSGVCRRVVELLLHKNDAVVCSALRTVGNIVTGDDVQTQVVLNCSVLLSLQYLLSSNHETISKESTWAISNITAGNKDQIQQVIEANVFPNLIHNMIYADLRTRKEAAWAVTNATSGGTPDQIKYMVQLGCVKPMCDLLVLHEPKINAVALNGLNNILKVGCLVARSHPENQNPYAIQVEECGGIDKLESLQSHANQEICDKAFSILEKYFMKDSDIN